MPLPLKVTLAENKPLICTTTAVEIHEEPVGLIVEKDKSYLYPKIDFSQRFPNITIRTKDHKETLVRLKQIVISNIIRLEERHANFCWHYKAEVCFYMKNTPPTPYLTNSSTDFNRRHSLNPFPEKNAGLFRRPDIIIVKDKNIRWPGLAGPEINNKTAIHPNNLARLVEIKFPGDKLSKEQQYSYLSIVGENESLFTLLEILDCRDQQQYESDEAYNLYLNSLTKQEKYQKIDEIPPIYSSDPFPAGPPPQVQPWALEIESPVASFGAGSAKAAQLDPKDLVKHAVTSSKAWLSGLHGKWQYQATQQGWKNLHTGEFWSLQHLRSVWLNIQLETDLTLWVLTHVNWHHVFIIGGLLACLSVALVLASGAAFTVIVSTDLAAAFLVILSLHHQFGSDFTQQLAV